MKNKWTDNEKSILLGYTQSSDEETVEDTLEYIRHMMYFEGNHPELKERSIGAIKNMYYKVTNGI
ncbi:hypothetical protein [uncultured Dysgonomonas sp.]|uniref:Uncharacterized protein n=1 Tax=uncultured Dysgonomonas sp. TaxID=206096 RepID=A0A212IXU8_9BACT|nr:hypothetical protein [uncultured Dysgonomonas sp.]SBV92039.1 hypothetical protein KL86DYS1_10502 [uncultured Dysgonomonas sp.]